MLRMFMLTPCLYQYATPTIEFVSITSNRSTRRSAVTIVVSSRKTQKRKESGPFQSGNTCLFIQLRKAIAYYVKVELILMAEPLDLRHTKTRDGRRMFEIEISYRRKFSPPAVNGLGTGDVRKSDLCLFAIGLRAKRYGR